MAGQETNPSSGKPGNRAFPVLIPQGALQGQPDVPLDRPVTTVGSNENARLHLVSRTVSKGHAIFVNDGPVTYVADLASRTGVLVNAKLVKEAQLKSGDRVQIGKFVFRFRSATLPGTPAPQPPAASVIVVGWPAMPIGTRVVQIGRRDTSDIAFTDDAGVSAAHAVIFQMNGSWYIRDVGSRTGTLVNGKTIHQQALNFGDRIVIGSSTILFQPSVVSEELEEEPPIAEGLSPIPSHLPADAEEDLDGGSIDLNPVSDPVPVDEEEAIPLEEAPAPLPVPVARVEEEVVEEPIPLEEPAASAALLDEQIAEPVTSPLDELPAFEHVAEPLPVEEPVAEPLGSHTETIEPTEPSGSAAGATTIHADLPEDFVSEPAGAIEETLPVEEPAAEPLGSHTETIEPTEPRGSAAGAIVETLPFEEPAAEPLGSLVETTEQADRSAAGVTDESTVHEPLAEATPLPESEPPVVASEEEIAIDDHSTIDFADETTAMSAPSQADHAQPVVADEQEVAAADQNDIAFADESAVAESASPAVEETPAVAASSQQPTPPVIAAAEPEAVEPPQVVQPAAEHLGAHLVPATPVVPPELVAEVDDFVFVPGAEVADPGEIPEVLFWGEEDESAPATPQAHGATVEAVLPPDASETPSEAAAPQAPRTADEQIPLQDAGSDVLRRAGSDGEHVDSAESSSIDINAEPATQVTAIPAEQISIDQAVESPPLEAEHPVSESMPAEPVETVSPTPGNETSLTDVSDAAPVESELAEPTEIETGTAESVDEMEPMPFGSESAETPASKPELPVAETSSAAVISVNSNDRAEPAAAPESAGEAHIPEYENDDLIFQDVIDPAAIEELEAHATDFIQSPVMPSPPGSLTHNENNEVVAPPPSAVVSESLPTMAVAVTAAGTPTPAVDDLASILADARQQLDADEPHVSAGPELPDEPIELEHLEAAVEEPPVAVEDNEPLLTEAIESVDEIQPPAAVDWSSLSTVDEVAPDANVVHSDEPIVEPTADGEFVEPVIDEEPEWIEPEPDDLEMESLAEDSLIGGGGGAVDEPEVEEPPSGFELAAEEPAPAAEEPAADEPADAPPGSLISATDEVPLGDGAAHVAPPVGQVDTDDLAFLEFTEPPVEPQAVTELTPAEPVDLAPVEEAPAPEKPKATRPPLFGFDFDGGSFLGGMPLPLHTPAPAPLKPPVPVSRDVAFDARATPPSGLSATVAAKPVMRKTEPPVTPAPVAPPSVVPPGPPAATPPPSTTRRPAGPPAPSPGKSRAPAAPPSRTGLETDAPAPFGQSPSVQPPPRPFPGKTARPRPSPGRVTTSNFSVPARPNGSADIFSQASSPIGVEVFGAPIPNPEQIVIPDIKKTAKDPGAEGAANPGAASGQPVKKTRSSRLPLLITLLIALPAAFWFLSNRFVPVSSQIVGTLKFNSLEADSPDAENFRNGQEARLQSPDVRQEAMAILKRQNVPPGFLADEEQYIGIVGKQNLTWNPNGSLDFTYHTSDPERGRLRVDAILSALKEKDQDLQDLRDRTLATANAAKASRTTLEAEGKRLAARHLELAARAERRPDGLEMEQAKSEVKAARLKWTDAQSMLQSSRDALAKLQNQDPNVPPDIDADPQIVKLKKELALLDDQVRARKSGSINSSTPHGLGTDVPIGATTQPDNTGDSVLADLQDRIALQQKKLDNRLAELSALRAMGPAQRQVNLDKQKENLSISISKLSGDEQLAKSAYDNAAAKLAGLDDQMKDAVIAEASKEEVKEQMSQNNQARSKALLDETDAEQKLASCVTVADLNGEPNPRIGPAVVQADLRTPAFCMSTAISCFVLGILILGEIRRPKLITNVRRPDAAPLINQPMRVVPWPQPRQLEGLNEAPAVEEMAV